MEGILAKLASKVAREGREGLTQTCIPNVGLYQVSRCIDLLPETYRPLVSLIVQGEKRLSIGNEVLTYHAGHTFTAAFDIPALGRITEASQQRPYLAISLAINPELDAIRAMPPEMMPDELRQALPLWETPEFSATVLAALSDDAKLSSFSGKVVIGAELGERYGIKDGDGKQPISYRAAMGHPLEFHGAPQK